MDTLIQKTAKPATEAGKGLSVFHNYAQLRARSSWPFVWNPNAYTIQAVTSKLAQRHVHRCSPAP